MFSGRLVYRIVCANINDRMQIDKLKKINKLSEKNYKQLIEQLHESVILTEENNEIFYYNKMASQIFGFEYSKKKEDKDIPV